MSKGLERIEYGLCRIEQLEKECHRLAGEMFRTDNGSIFPLDLLFAGILHRFIMTSTNFRNLIEIRNYVCAYPLIRFQLDSILRAFATSLVSTPHEMVGDIMNGSHIRKMKDRDGNLMTDRYLLSKLAKTHSFGELQTIYDRASSYIHLSDSHIFSVIKRKEKESSILQFSIGGSDDLPDESYFSAVCTFYVVSWVLLAITRDWINQKDPSRKVQIKPADTRLSQYKERISDSPT